MILSLVVFGVLADDGNSTGILISGILGFTGAAATLYGVITTYKSRRRELELATRTADLAERQQKLEERSVTFEQMNEAIPGLGEMVKLYEGRAKEAILDAIAVRKEIAALRDEAFGKQLADHNRIIDLEGQVRAVTAELIEQKKMNLRLEDEIDVLKRRTK